MRVKATDEFTIEILGEKHTLLNLIRWCIYKFESVYEIELVGYTIPHPMEDKAIMKIQLKDSTNQTKKHILDVFQRGIESAQQITHHLSTLIVRAA
ncbi:DNA-directed RNA polymerases I and III subunit RPAC2 [Nematocida homosporus]|uniref:DNA-directed RNA polymerases I and III subunit RPAC2 n=1 Tax=Nematocida homosporus TaxID=1912981 RepID=UPI00221EF159|nr:DNA-directed RNA polymerases I and III subunit RPAC2 [Nematocida homosporus]KAI5187207.1 DNA-directed RNA polymerases I and III subunit RPAC2 [Nematocida homosporus]